MPLRRTHPQLLGALLIGWGVANGFFLWALVRAMGEHRKTLEAMAASGQDVSTQGSTALTAIAVALGMLAVLYVGVGIALRTRPQVGPVLRAVGCAACGFALLSFPIGTVIGGYGLWVLLLRKAPARAPQ